MAPQDLSAATTSPMARSDRQRRQHRLSSDDRDRCRSSPLAMARPATKPPAAIPSAAS